MDRVTVHVEGGLFGDDRIVDVALAPGPCAVRVLDHGELVAERRLAPAEADRVRRLATAVRAARSAERGRTAVDGGTVTVTVRAADRQRVLRLSAGERPSGSLQSLLDEIDGLRRNAGP